MAEHDKALNVFSKRFFFFAFSIHRSNGIQIFVGCVSYVSYAFYANTAHDINIVNSNIGTVALHCNQVSGLNEWPNVH